MSVTLKTERREVSASVIDSQVELVVTKRTVEATVFDRSVTATLDQRTVTATTNACGDVNLTIETRQIVAEAPVRDVTVNVLSTNVIVMEDVRAVELTIENRPVEVEVGKCVQLVIRDPDLGGLLLDDYVTDEALTYGDIVAVNDAGHVEKARHDGTWWRAVGISTGVYAIGEVAQINGRQGRKLDVRYDVAQVATDRGKPVFLSSTPGLATATQPVTGRIIELGVLSEADGVAITSETVWAPLAPNGFPAIDEFFPTIVLVSSNYPLTEFPLANTLTVYLNGKRLAQGVGCDYILAGKTITLMRKVKPGFIVAAEYKHN